MYNLDYTVTEDDYLTFNRCHLKTTKAGRRAILTYRLLVPALLVCIMLLSTIGGGDVVPLLTIEAVVFGLTSLLWALLAPRIYFRSLRRGINRMKKDGRLPFNPQGTFVFSEDGFEDHGPLSTVTTSYQAIEKVVEAPAADYLYVSAAQAFIVKTDLFADAAAHQQFIDFITARLKPGTPVVKA